MRLPEQKQILRFASHRLQKPNPVFDGNGIHIITTQPQRFSFTGWVFQEPGTDGMQQPWELIQIEY